MGELQQVSAAFASLVAGIKDDVVSLRSKDRDERVLLENARATALQVTRLVELVEERVTVLFGAEQSDGLTDAASTLRGCVVDLLQSAKSSFEHPLDFVRSQQLSDAAHAVQQAIIRLEGRFDALCAKSAAPASAGSFGAPPAYAPGSSAALQAPAQTPSPSRSSIAALARRFGEKIAVVAQVALQQHSEDGPLHTAMREAVVALKELSEAAPEREDTKTVISATQQLLHHVRSLCETQSADDQDDVRESVAYVTSLVRQLADAAAREAKKEAGAAQSARELAEDAVDAVVGASPGMSVEWGEIGSDEQALVVGVVEKLICDYLRRRTALTATSAVPAPVAVPTATVLRGRSVTVKPTPSRLRATTSSVAANASGAIGGAGGKSREALVKFLGVNDMKQWNALLEEGSVIHVGGMLGDVHIAKEGKNNFEQIVKHCVAFVLSSNAASISKKSATRETVEQAAKSLVADVAAAAAAVRESLPDSFSPEVEELLVSATQRVAAFDAAVVEPNEYMLADPEPFRTFSGLLKQLHVCSKHMRAACIHLTTSLLARGKREQSQRLSERMAALAPSLVLQIAASVIALLDLMAVLMRVVVTVRALSNAAAIPGASPPASPRESFKSGASDEVSFWKEKTRSASSAATTPVQPQSPFMSHHAPPHSPEQQHHTKGSGKRFGFFRRGEEAELPKSKNKGDFPKSDSSGGSGGGSSSSSSASPTVTFGGVEDMEGLPKRGTLNTLIEAVTHPKHYSPLYMQAFIATMHSFSNSSTVLSRLLERFDCPATIPAAERDAIQVRVPLVLKYWIETQPDDFDDTMLSRLDRFAKSLAAVEMGALLTKELARLASNRKNRRAVFEAPPTECGPIENIDMDSPADLFLKIEPSEIGRQLTLIDFGLFASIQPLELQNQMWSKAKLQHRAPHVVALVSRLNRVSYWAATTILMQDSDEARTNAVARFIEVAKFLRSVNNFHTLMGIVAGLNMAAVSKSRLKQTWARVDAQLQQEFAELEALMSPSSSFKLYRAALRQAKPPSMPYVGSVCGDLTFIDEGNPDSVDGLVNFEKRLQVHRVLQEVEGHARVPYSFPKLEPFHTLFTVFPTFGDKDLYSLSLAIEHRPS